MQTDHPVWTISPNWEGGVLERLEWLTDVIVSDSADEQRRSVRWSPRRSFEMTINPANEDRTYVDLALHRLGATEWLMPLWHDQATLDIGAGAGFNVLNIDNTFREFRPGDFAILYQDTFTWEVVSIASMTDTTLELTGGVEQGWPAGTLVYPLRIMTVSDETNLAALSSRIGQSVLLWTVNEANDYVEIPPAGPQYQGAPILAIEPDRSRDLTAQHVRFMFEQDGSLGLRKRVAQVDRAFSVRSHSWMVRGRQAQHGLRGMLYWMQGRQRSVWLPTFNQDLTLTKAVPAGTNDITIRKIGIGYIGGGPIPGRARFWTGQEVVLHASNQAAPTAKEELLRSAAPVASSYAPGASWSFLEPARLNQDNVEIKHYADSAGVAECAVTFQTFPNDREVPMPIYTPIPISAKTAGACGDI